MRAVDLSVEGVGLMALGSAKVIVGEFSGQASLLYEIRHELR